ncbi:MAG: hypothetical protein GY882_09640, partial [Actinomycetia bacterium]|nr:hypothetical protein [Actinomycetes bacterium]
MVTLGYTASAVDLLELPEGCNLAPESCTPSAACRVSECNPLTGLCVEEDEDDGTSCDDGFSATSGDACMAGLCKGMVEVAPSLFRVTDMDLTAPDFAYDFGGGAADMNPVLNALINATLVPSDMPTHDAILMAKVDPMVFDFPYATLTLGYGWCEHDDGQVTGCQMHADLPSSSAAVAMYSADADCHSAPNIPAPCFATEVLPTGQFHLDTMVLDCSDITVTATWAGDPVDSLEPGIIDMFVSETAAAAIEADIGA